MRETALASRASERELLRAVNRAGGGSAGTMASGSGCSAGGTHAGGGPSATGGTSGAPSGGMNGTGGNVSGGGAGGASGGVGGESGSASGGAAAGGAASAGGGAGGAGGGSASLEPCSVEAEMTVVTFNIRYAGGAATDPNAWNNANNPRRERVTQMIESLAPDLLGVQEALSLQVVDLTAAFPEYGFVGVGRDDGATQGEYAGIFYRKDVFELLDAGQFWLSETPDQPGTVFFGSGSIRLATWVTLRQTATGRELYYLNTHWDNVSQSSREASAALIRQKMGELSGERPILMTGDLNQTPSNAAVQALLSPTPPETTLLDGYRQANPAASTNELTYHAFEGTTQGERIDYVLHASAFLTHAATIHRETFDGLYPSDHYPVSAVLGWSADDAGEPCSAGSAEMP